MKPELINELEPCRLMDEAVAHMVMGWHIERWSHSGDGGYDMCDASGKMVAAWDAPYGFKPEDTEPRWRFSPSTDIKAAERVWKQMIANGYTLTLEHNTKYYVCRFGAFFGIGNTAALAISRAALHAVNHYGTVVTWKE